MHIRRFFSPITILIILCLVIGIYKTSVTTCVANDSVTFMQFAQTMKNSPAQAIQSYDQHPGYPAMILAAEWVADKLGYDPTLGHRIIAAQAATLICRTTAILFIFLISRFFGSQKTALVSACMVALIPGYANNGSEVLSDWPNLMLMSAAFFFCLNGLRKTSVLSFALAGLFSGLAYWIRPEGAVFVVITGIYTLIHLFAKEPKKTRLCVCCCGMIICAAAITTPYMLMKGALFPKKKVGVFSQHVFSERSGDPQESIQPYLVQAGIAEIDFPVKIVKAIWRFLEELFNTIYLLTIPMLGIIIYKMTRFRHLRSQDRFLCLFCGVWLCLLIWLYCRHGYISDRHIMPLAVFGFAWILKGLHGLALMVCKDRRTLHRNTAILIGVCMAVFVPKLLEPVRKDKSPWRQAGVWLKENTPSDATIAVFDSRIGFYAERSYSSLLTKNSAKQDYLVFKASDIPDVLPQNALLIATGVKDIDNVISIYQIHP